MCLVRLRAGGQALGSGPPVALQLSTFSGFLRKQLISRMILKILATPHKQVGRPWSQTNRESAIQTEVLNVSGAVCAPAI